MRLKVLLGLLALLVAGCVAEAFSGGGSHGRPCRKGDRRCVNSKTAAPLYALEIFWGGVDAGQVATGAAVTTASGQPVTLARASPTLCQKTDGTFAHLASGAPCVEPNGLAVRQQTINILPLSSNLTTWTADNTTLTTGASCPDGTSGGVTLADNAVNTNHRTYLGMGGTDRGAGSYTFSVFAKPAPAPLNFIMLDLGTSLQAIYDLNNGTLALNGAADTYGGFSTTNTAFNITPAANGFFLLTMTIHEPNGAGFAEIYIGDSPARLTGGYAGSGNGVILCDPIITFAASTVPGDFRPYFPNDGGTTATRQADLYSVANPLDGGPMVLAATVLADGYKWDTGMTHSVLSGGYDAGPMGGDSNTWSWWISDAGFQELTVTDTNGGTNIYTGGAVVWPGVRHIKVVDVSGTVTMFQSGALDGGLLSVPVTLNGTGLGYVASQPSTIFVGSQGSFGGQLGGVIMDACGNNDTGTGCDYQFTKQFASLPPAKTLVAFGDSLTFNQTVGWKANTWMAMLQADSPGWTTYNEGWGGSTLAQEAQIYADAGFYQTPKRYTSLETGINDFTTLKYSTVAVYEFFLKWQWDKFAASGTIPFVIRESPWGNSVSSGATQQTNWATLQAWIDSEAKLYLYPYVDEWKCTTPATPGVCLWDAGTGSDPTTDPAVILCQYDYDTDGVTPVFGCPGGSTAPNWVHLRDAGQAVVEHDVRHALGLQ